MLETKQDNGVWNTNNGKFDTNEMEIAKDITLPRLSSKRRINNATLSINPNKGQKYQAMFGITFLIDNAIDCINRKMEIYW